jgi:flavin reductase (DIM6/NTAB) family NADH-FMN oxidoreductase RutF
VDGDLFREVMSGFPSGVTVVTAREWRGRVVGLTVSAYCSVSTEPPMVLVCVDDQSNTLPVIRTSRAFTVNVLAAGSEELAARFASKRDDKFAGVVVTEPLLASAGPILAEAAAAFCVCRLERELVVGDHSILIGAVEDAGTFHDRPLLYHRRTYSALGGALSTDPGAGHGRRQRRSAQGLRPQYGDSRG